MIVHALVVQRIDFHHLFRVLKAQRILNFANVPLLVVLPLHEITVYAIAPFERK